jgi:hypothetical protein
METKVKQLHTDVSITDNKKSGEELIKRKDIKDSPFEIITINGESFGAMGQYRITEKGKFKDIEKELSKITWNRIVQVVMLLDEAKEKVKTDKK